jgi:hypothetical protein
MVLSIVPWKKSDSVDRDHWPREPEAFPVTFTECVKIVSPSRGSWMFTAGSAIALGTATIIAKSGSRMNSMDRPHMAMSLTVR